MRPDQIIIEPILTEKANRLREESEKKYTFRVAKDANKFQIASALKELFGVDAISCNTLNYKGKPKFSRGKGGYVKGYTSSWKKAVVTLKKGQEIKEIENV